MKIKDIDPSEVTNIKMVAGNEKKFTKIIDWQPVVKKWVGIGWLTLGEPTAAEFKKLKMVRRKL